MATTKRRAFDVDDVPVKENADRTRPSDLVDVMQFSSGWRSIRPIGSVFAYGAHWVTTKKRDGSKGSFKVPCLAFDPETGERDSTKPCPWCEHQAKHPGSKESPGLVRFTPEYWFNAIDRKAQESAPSKMPRMAAEEKESGFKTKDSDSWTPVKAVQMSGNDLKKIRNLRELNVRRNKATGESKSYSVFDGRFGANINVNLDKNNPVPANRVSVQIGEKCALDEDEQKYLVWDLSSLESEMTLATAKSEYKSWATRMEVESDDEDDEDKPKRRTKGEVTNDMKKKSAAALKAAMGDDEDDEDDDDAPPSKKGKKPSVDEDDDDEFDTPVKKKAPAKGKKVVDDDDEDEDDEDDEPPVKKKSPPAKGKKAAVEDDEDDEDDEPPVKKKAPVKGKKPSVDEDDDDEDDEDDEPPARKGKAASAKGKKVVDEDDDEDDEDDEPPVKKKSAPAKGKKPVVEDDDDEDLCF